MSILLIAALLLIQFALAMPAPAVAAVPQPVAEAPANPDFEAWLQNQNVRLVQPAQQSPQSVTTGLQKEERPLGLIPRPIDLRHLDRIPVTAAARLQNKPAALSQAASSGAPSAVGVTLGLPASFDWRTWDGGKVTSVRDQYSCGTCWAFGTMAAFESRTWIQANSMNDFSEQNLVCCSDPAWYYLTGRRCNAGGWDFIAVDTLIKKGARLESCDLYNTSTINSEACLGCSTSYKATGFRTVCSTARGYEAAIKDAIYNYGPVEAAFYYSSGTVYALPPSTAPSNIIHYPNCTTGRNHLICIVGWDDSFSYGGVTGAWIIKNSWGLGAGQSGYYYMTYGSSNLGDVGYFSSVSTADPNEALYYYDEAGMVNSFGYGGNSAWMANVFTAGQDGRLTAVDFWTTSNNAQYLINIYSGSFGSLLATQSGVCAEEGYYSIPLAAAVNLTAGQQFTVAVKPTTLGYNYPLPIERAWSPYCNPPIQTGVSFAKHYEGDVWSDLGSAYTTKYNACLRARVSSSPPGAPPLSSPAPVANVPGTQVTFYWTAPSGAGIDNYWLRVNTNSSFTGTDIVSAPVGYVGSATISGFSNTGATYYWYVVAHNAAGWGAASSTNSFINGAALSLPGAPPLSSPGPGANVAGSAVTFSWTAPSGTGIDNYWLRVNTNSDFTGTDIYSGGVGYVGSARISGFSNTGATYYWYVLAHNAVGWGSASITSSIINGP